VSRDHPPTTASPTATTTTRKKPRGGRRLARLLLFALVQLVLFAGLLEVALRLLEPRHRGLRPLLYLSSVETHYGSVDSLPALLDKSVLGFSPHFEYYGFVLNSRSFRTKEYSERKPAGTYRVLAFGDSFTFASGGLPDPDHWPTLLEGRLRESRGGEVEVLRLGVPGTGPQFQLRLWQLEGMRLDSDLVILGFFVGNDFTRTARGVRQLTDLSDRLATWSYAFRALRNGLRLYRGVEGQAPVLGRRAKGKKRRHETGGFEIPSYRETFDPERPTFSADAFLAIEEKRMALCLKSERDAFDARFEAAALTLQAFHREVSRSGAEFLVMVIPDEYQVNPAVRRAVLGRNGRSEGDYDLEAPQKRLAELFAADGIPYVDLLPDFLQRAGDGALYRPRDTHWSRAGNLLATEVLMRHLENRS
jgi:hypothetical protein